MTTVYQPTAQLVAFRRAVASLSAQDLVTLGRAQQVSDRNCTDDRRIRLVEDLLNATVAARHDERPNHGWRLWRTIIQTEAEFAYYKAEIAANGEIKALRARIGPASDREQAQLIEAGLEALTRAMMAINQRPYLSGADYSFLIGPWALHAGRHRP
jgi:hypothetical protein